MKSQSYLFFCILSVLTNQVFAEHVEQDVTTFFRNPGGTTRATTSSVNGLLSALTSREEWRRESATNSAMRLVGPGSATPSGELFAGLLEIYTGWYDADARNRAAKIAEEIPKNHPMSPAGVYCLVTANIGVNLAGIGNIIPKRIGAAATQLRGLIKTVDATGKTVESKGAYSLLPLTFTQVKQTPTVLASMGPTVSRLEYEARYNNLGIALGARYGSDGRAIISLDIPGAGGNREFPSSREAGIFAMAQIATNGDLVAARRAADEATSRGLCRRAETPASSLAPISVVAGTNF